MTRGAFNARNWYFGNLWCVPVGHQERRCRSELGGAALVTGATGHDQLLLAAPACPPLCCSLGSAWALDSLSVTLHRAEPEGTKRNLPSKPAKLNLVLIVCSVCCESSAFVPEAAS